MKIYVVGSSKNKFLPLDTIRKKFLINEKHEGDNIDHLNPWYCELTGLYYLWKHETDDIVGLEHYRRYFVNERNEKLSENEIRKRLESCDIICSKMPYSRYRPVITWFNGSKKRVDIERFLLFCKHYVGNEYVNECRKILNGDYHCLGNMFICKKELIDEYCEFMFDVLFMFQAAESHFGRALTPRIMGYFTEFLFAAWVNLHQKKIGWSKWRLVK